MNYYLIWSTTGSESKKSSYSSSVAAAAEKSWVSRNAEITVGSVDSVGSIWAILSMLTNRRLTPWRLPKKE